MSAPVAAPAGAPSIAERWHKKWKPWCIKNFLPLGLVFCFALALSWPWLGEQVASWKSGEFRVVQTALVCLIFVISGVTLKTADIVGAVTAYAALGYGLVAIVLITPMLGFAAVDIPFKPAEFKIGLAVFCCVPTTLTSGVTLAQQAKGNGALALMLTVVSNLLGVFTVPFLLELVVDSADVSVDGVALLLKLAVSILLPLAVGKSMREFLGGFSKTVQRFVTRHKVELGLTNNAALLCIVWQNLSRSRDDLINCSAGEIFLMLFAGVCVHVIFLVFNWTAATHVLRLPEKQRRSVIILTSQKTLPVAITVISYLDESAVGRHGLIAIPCIVGHMTQLFMDAVFVSRWAAIDPDKQPSRLQQELSSIAIGGGAAEEAGTAASDSPPADGEPPDKPGC